MSRFTLRELLSQPEIWNTVSLYVKQNEIEFASYLKKCQDKTLTFIGSGTSYYLALSAASVYSKFTEERSRAVSASEILFFPELIFPDSGYHDAVMLISRSGTTTEVLRAGDIVEKQLKLPTCSLTCRPNSKLTTYGYNQFVLPEADEKSVVMTRSFTSMLLLIQFLAAIKVNNRKYFEELSQLSEEGKAVINEYRASIKEIGENDNITKFVYLGQGPYYGLACESMLKIKEMSKSTSEAFHSLEYRHGPMSMLDDQTLLTFFLSDSARAEETKLIKEMKELGAKILVLCNHSDNVIKKHADYIIELKSELSEFTRLILYMPMTQLLGYYRSISNGLDPDNPQNLTQVVTFY